MGRAPSARNLAILLEQQRTPVPAAATEPWYLCAYFCVRQQRVRQLARVCVPAGRPSPVSRYVGLRTSGIVRLDGVERARSGAKRRRRKQEKLGGVRTYPNGRVEVDVPRSG